MAYIEKCSFCGRDASHADGMIQSPCSQAYICGSCASIAAKNIGGGLAGAKGGQSKCIKKS